MQASVLTQTAMSSVLRTGSVLKPQGEAHKRSMAADLLLTALIDAFSILVIFLLMSFSSTGDLLDIGKGMELPKAALTEMLDRNPVIRVESDKIYIEQKEITQDQLVAELLALREKFREIHPNEEFPGVVTIQADRRLKYESLNAVVLATNHAGYSDIKFATLVK